MATPTIVAPEPVLPINNLAKFVDATESLIDNVVGPWISIVAPSAYRSELVSAWREAKPSMSVIRTQCSNVRDTNPAAPNALTMAGLSGAQLKLKLKAVSHAWRRFRTHGTVKLLANLVGWTKAIVESLAKAIPHAEAIKELLEFIEKLLKGESPFEVELAAV
jgi:hypothetical protein